MSDDPISERVSRLAGEALSAQARIVRESVEVSRDAWSPGTDPAALSKAWTELVTSESQRYWQALATIGLDTARELLALNTRTSAAVLRGLSEATGTRRYAAPSHPSGSPGSAGSAGSAPGGRRHEGSSEGRRESHHDHAHDHDHESDHGHAHDHGHGHGHDHDPAHDHDQRVTGPAEAAGHPAPGEGRHGAMQLFGPSGAIARGTLTVANRHPRARRVTVTASELRDAAEGAVAAVTLSVSPERLTVPPGEERQIEVSVELDPAAIRPGRVYAATLEVSGGDDARIDVVVSADPVD